MQKTIENGIEYRALPVPEGFTVLETYHPHSCPWDYYGGKFIREMRHVLNSAGIESADCSIMQRKTAPMGSGSGGRVRFGDDMLPGVYRIAVSADDIGAASKAIADHRAAVHNWLHNSGTMPAACRA